ncbi:hypothetical protein [Bradyrhizobium mercantei]|uniref:hypothetical protein n=1 Tax=Bradyrhizobium mercantei TaxID=1904807 RepID=UPI0009753F09|nr:hypothetical protein [Bradyrhizobium mercantei]
MADDKKDRGLAFAKDAVVLVPLVGSALAMSWEVGSFFPIGLSAFSLFSVTEHLAFAIPALPFAIFTAVSLLVGDVVSDSIIRFQNPIEATKKETRKRPARVRWFRILVPAIGILFASIAFYFNPSATYVACVVALVLMALTFGFEIDPATRIRVIMLGAGSAILIFSFALGVDSMRQVLNKASETTLETTGGTLSAIMVRSGERGILIYERSRLRFDFVKWDSIKSTSWQRKQLTFFR